MHVFVIIIIHILPESPYIFQMFCDRKDPILKSESKSKYHKFNQKYSQEPVSPVVTLNTPESWCKVQSWRVPAVLIWCFLLLQRVFSAGTPTGPQQSMALLRMVSCSFGACFLMANNSPPPPTLLFLILIVLPVPPLAPLPCQLPPKLFVC